jgi:uncharacterized spore protein YtfJ
MENSRGDNMSSQGSFVERLAQRLGISANADSIYGEPVEREGVTVIPVAKAMYGFGGGSGKKAGEEGTGGGGGVSITPIGYIEIKDGTTRFRSIRDSQMVMKIIAVSGLMALLTARTIGKMLRRKKG